MRHVFAALILAIATSPAAAKGCEHDALFDSWGAVKFQDKVTSARMDKLASRTAECDFENDDSCTYRDKSGIAYRVVEGYIDYKELDLLTAPKVTKLPFGIARQDTPASAAAKFRKRYGIVLKLSRDTDERNAPIQVLSNDCVNANVWLSLYFDPRGRLLSVRTFVASVRL